MKNNAIFIMTNGNYFDLTIAFLNSIKKNWSNHPLILCHHNEMSNNQLEVLSLYKNVKLIPIELDDRETRLNITMLRDRHMMISYFKLRAWFSEYDQYDNIIYLDIDMLVLKPLDDLLNVDEFTIMQDPVHLYFLKKGEDEKLRKNLNEDGILQYFNENIESKMINAGIFVLPKKYRTKENYDYICYLAKRYNHYNYYGDQTIITLWGLKNNISPTLDMRYNFFSLQFNYCKYDLNNISIIHFVSVKPTEREKFMNWDLLTNAKSELLELFNYYLTLKI